MSKVVREDEHAWRGNDNLRKADFEHEYTVAEIHEIEKCRKDPIYFITNYCKIVTDEGFELFKLYPYQEEYIKILQGSKEIIAKWARQSGKTITTAAFICHYIIFNEAKQVGILAHQADGAREILGRIQDMYESIPLWLQAGVIEWNKGRLKLDNGCKVITAATKSTGIRGKSCNIIYIDEVAFIPEADFEKFFKSVYPTMASFKDTKLIISSTPDGLNHFYKMWIEAIEGVSDFVPHEIHWYDPPGRDEAFKQKTIRNTSLEQWLQEFECDFLGASGAIIKSETINAIPKRHPKSTQFDGKFRIYEDPNPDDTYVLLCDVSEGVGKDASTIQVINLSHYPYRAVAVFQDNEIKSNLFHYTIQKIAYVYNEAIVVVESNNVGREVLNNLWYEAEYENLFKQPDLKDPGLRTTKSVKNIGATEMKYLIENKFLEIYDIPTIAELSNFIKLENGKIQGKKGCNDDLVIPLVHFGYILGNKKLFEMWFEHVQTGAINKGMIDKIDSELLPMGWVNDGHGFQAMDNFDELDDFGLFDSGNYERDPSKIEESW